MKRLHVATLIILAFFLLTAAGISEERRGTFVLPPRSVRDRDFDQRHIRLELTFSLEDQKVTGRVVHRLAPFVPLAAIELDAAEMKISVVRPSATCTPVASAAQSSIVGPDGHIPSLTESAKA